MNLLTPSSEDLQEYREQIIAEERELIATYIEEQKFDAWLTDVHGVWNKIVAGEIVALVREVADAIRRGEYGR